MKTPQPSKCCEFCKRGVPDSYCKKPDCPCHHPKEPPVSQSVEGWEKEFVEKKKIVKKCGENMNQFIIKRILSGANGL